MAITQRVLRGRIIDRAGIAVPCTAPLHQLLTNGTPNSIEEIATRDIPLHTEISITPVRHIAPLPRQP